MGKVVCVVLIREFLEYMEKIVLKQLTMGLNSLIISEAGTTRNKNLSTFKGDLRVCMIFLYHNWELLLKLRIRFLGLKIMLGPVIPFRGA